MPIHVAEAELPELRHDHGETFPVALVCSSTGTSLTPNSPPTLQDACEWVRQHRERMVQHAASCGAVLFRGFPLVTDRDFDAFVASFELPNFRYEECLSNAVRVVRTERVFTANEAPADVRIFLHHEMAQTPVYPSKLFFFCEQAASAGGATPLCRSDLLFERITEELPDFADKCSRLGLRYSHVMPGANDSSSGMGRSWQSTLRASDRSAAEQRLKSLNYTWEWLDNDCLKVRTPVLPATKTLSNGRTAFFNQLIAAFHGWKDSRNDPTKAITFGDDSRLDASQMTRVIEMAEELTFDMQWQNGDVVLVDNFVAMHGRRTFQGTRKVLVSLIR